jgi:hypothetical protein
MARLEGVEMFLRRLIRLKIVSHTEETSLLSSFLF